MKPIFFLLATLTVLLCACARPKPLLVSTAGAFSPSARGIILPHEHIFTDLRGPNTPGYGEANADEVSAVMRPLLITAREHGVETIVECTTIGVGRNIPIIQRLANETGLRIIVPTGVYGRAHFAPSKYREMTESELAQWMIAEIENGIEQTGVKAGFIKTAASEEALKPLEEKFLRASALAAKRTGVAIASHTTSGKVAVQQAELLEQMGVPLHRFIWVHAQAEKNLEFHFELGRKGVFIELDSVGASADGDEDLRKVILALIEHGLTSQILLSHDAGWYNPGQPLGGKQRGYTSLVTDFIPKLRQNSESQKTIQQIISENPARAFGKLGPLAGANVPGRD